MRLSRGKAADLYDKHVRGALRLAVLLTGDAHLAEDLVQDAFVRCFTRFQDLRRPDSFAPYLRRTIVNLSKDHWRKLERERALAHRTPGRGEDSSLDRLTESAVLLDHLQSLPPRQRAAVVLRHCEGFSEREVADVLGTSVKAINSLIARGLATLRLHMGSESVE